MSYVYNRKTWETGEVIYAVDLNNMEEGIEKANLAASRSPEHTHGNITYDGKIGSTADLPVFTGTDGNVVVIDVATARRILGIPDTDDEVLETGTTPVSGAAVAAYVAAKIAEITNYEEVQF